uniref:Uncharacterized protein n=1 Tax=Podarcis muralis TaxID=64176 RepID=A0A670K0A5_PODMU
MESQVSSGPQFNTTSAPDGHSRNCPSPAKTSLGVNYLPQEEFRYLFRSIGETESCKLMRKKITALKVVGTASHECVNLARIFLNIKKTKKPFNLSWSKSIKPIGLSGREVARWVSTDWPQI